MNDVSRSEVNTLQEGVARLEVRVENAEKTAVKNEMKLDKLHERMDDLPDEKQIAVMFDAGFGRLLRQGMASLAAVTAGMLTLITEWWKHLG